MFNAIMFMLFFHFVGDFYLQTEKQASNKWHSAMALLRHVLVYTACLVVFGACFGIPGLLWAVVNGIIHFALDFCTSKATHLLYENNQIHDFFVVLGADQCFHLLMLIYTFECIVLN